MAANEEPTTPGQVSSVVNIPGYRIQSVLGRGGMATVYLAVQLSIEREVALKTLSPDHTDPSFSERFLREARIVSGMSHPNIVTIYDAGVHQGCHYMAMEYIPGKNFQKVGQRLPLRHKLDIIKETTQALIYAHGKGYVHRDIKPENIMLHEDGRAILTDFGIARGEDANHALTQTGKALGTPYYMSPEQAKGLKVDHRSDIYSLGVVLFQALTGYVPYNGPSVVAIGIKHISSPIPELPRPLRPFQPVINKCLSKDPGHRYQKAEELLTALNAIAEAQLSAIVAHIKAAEQTRPRAPADIHGDTLEIPGVDASGIFPSTSGYVARSSARVDPIDVTLSEDVRRRRTRRRVAAIILLIALAGAAYVERERLQSAWFTTLAPHWASLTKQHTASDETPDAPAAPPAVPATPAWTDESVTAEEEITLVRLKALRERLGAKPEIAVELSRLYRAKLERDPDNAIVLNAMDELREWFGTNLQQALDDKQADKARRLFALMGESFPALASQPRYADIPQRIENIETFNLHLQKAQVYMAANALIKPPGANALEELQAARQIDGDHPEVQQGLQRVADYFFNQAQRLRNAGNKTEALVMVTTGLQEFPNDPRLLVLYDDMMGQIQHQRQTRRLISEAEQLVDKGLLIRPKGNNAYDTYQAVLRDDPENTRAIRGLHSIEQKLADRIAARIEQNQLTQAKEESHAALRLYPDSARLQQLEERVEKIYDEEVSHVTQIEFSTTPMRALTGRRDINRIPPGGTLYIGFQYKNFYGAATELQARLLSTGGERLKQQPVLVKGASGTHFFAMELPQDPPRGGSYRIELEMNDTPLIRARLSRLH